MRSVTPFIRAGKDSEGTQLWVTGEIGVDVRFADLQRALQYHSESGNETLIMNIYSHGGYLDDATAFYDWIADSGTKFKVRIWGTAMSAATVIAAAAGRENIEIAPNASWMIHETGGGTDEMRTIGNDALVRVYRTLTGKKEKEIRDMIAATTTLNATEAVKHGFAGKVMKSTMRLAAMWDAQPIETEEMENTTNTAKVALKVKLNLAQAMQSMVGDGTELEVTVDDAVATMVSEKDTTITALKAQIEVLEAAKPKEVITKEQLDEVTAKATELEGKVTAAATDMLTKDQQILTLTAELADLKKPLVEPIIPNNMVAEVGKQKVEDNPNVLFAKSVFGQMTDIEKAQHAARIKAQKAQA